MADGIPMNQELATSPSVILVGLHPANQGPSEQLGLGYIGSALRSAGAQVHFVPVSEEDNGDPELQSLLHDTTPLMVGIGCPHSCVNIEVFQRICSKIRLAAPLAHITCGGYFATFNPQDLLNAVPDIDSVVLGEGEATAAEIFQKLTSSASLSGIRGIATKTFPFKPRPAVESLDNLPFPWRYYHRVKEKKDAQREIPSRELALLSTSRGCQAHCTFCNVPRFTHLGGGWRGRSPNLIVDELASVVADSGVTRFWIVDSSYEDPSLEVGVRRMREIADGIINRGLKLTYYIQMRAENARTVRFLEVLPVLARSGLRRIFIGAESGLQSQLEAWRKLATVDDTVSAIENLVSRKMAVYAGFIMFTPESNFEGLRENIRFLRRINFLCSFAHLTGRMELYTGSAEVGRLKNRGLITGPFWNNPYAYRYVDERVGTAAAAIAATAREFGGRINSDALHEAELIVNSVLLNEELAQNSTILRHYELARQELDSKKRELEQLNEQFFLATLEIAESGWKDSHFKAAQVDFLKGLDAGLQSTPAMLGEQLLAAVVKQGQRLYY